jgi:hypothetical protein
VKEALFKALISGVVAALCVLALAVVLSGPSQRERQQTARNVTKLVDEAQLNRELLCLIVFNNPESTAWSKPRIVEICGDVGVQP